VPRHDEEGHRQNLQKYLRDHSTPDGTPSPDVWRQGMMDYVQLDVDASVYWNPIGPAPLQIAVEQNYQGAGPDSGEVTDIAIDPDGTTDQTIYIATNDGGIWKTGDGGTMWSPTMDDLLGLSMGAVAIDPTSPSIARVIYAGTGNLYDGGREFAKGVGLYRSSDGGSTWSIVDGGPFATVFAGAYITAIAVIAQDRILVASSKGLYLSIDGGQNFGSNSPSFDNAQPVVTSEVTCIVVDATNLNATKPDAPIYIGVSGVGVLKSTDGGVTFTNLFTAANGAPAAPIGNIEVAQSEQNPQVLFASVQVGADYTGLYRSMNGGQQWTLLPNVKAVAVVDRFGQTDYDLTLGIDPQVAVSDGNPPSPPQAGLIYVGFQELWQSKDGGQTFSSPACTSGQVHWDNHIIRFSPPANRVPASSTPVYIGTDGGIAKSTNGGTTWNGVNGDIGSTLFFGIDIGRGSANNNAYTYGGCQDTGHAGHLPGDANTTIWHALCNGDGGKVAVDPTNPQYVYGFRYAIGAPTPGGPIFTNDGGTTWQSLANLPIPSLPGYASVALDQTTGIAANVRKVYLGIEKALYKGDSQPGTVFAPPIFTFASQVTALTTTTKDPLRVWAGLLDGTVHYSADAGLNWDQGAFQGRPNPIPAGTPMAVTAIAVDPANADRVAVVYAGLSGIHSKYRTRHVFLTTDSGVTWNDISGTDGNGPNGNLPDLPYHSVVFDESTNPSPSAIIVACDAGVMRCTNATVAGGNVTATWKAYGVGLPTVSCSSLAIDNSVNPPVLRVGTYGRSCFEVTHATGPQIYVGPNLGFGSVPVAGSGTLALYTYNYGDAPLTITGINVEGATSFALNPAPTFPVTIPPGGTQAFSLVFSPSVISDETATLKISSNDAGSPSQVTVIGRAVAAANPRLATNPISLPTIGGNNASPTPADFGPTTAESPRSIPVQLFNVGTKELDISSITRTSGSSDFSLSPAPTFPISIPAGGQASVTIAYQPSSNGQASATFQIASNDPLTPSTLQVQGTGTAVSGSLWPYILLAIGAAVLVGGGVLAYEEFKK
jgi:hypothetical protein